MPRGARRRDAVTNDVFQVQTRVAAELSGGKRAENALGGGDQLLGPEGLEQDLAARDRPRRDVGPAGDVEHREIGAELARLLCQRPPSIAGMRMSVTSRSKRQSR